MTVADSRESEHAKPIFAFFTTAYYVLKYGRTYKDLGADHLNRIARAKMRRYYVKGLRSLAYKVDLTETNAAYTCYCRSSFHALLGRTRRHMIKRHSHRPVGVGLLAHASALAAEPGGPAPQDFRRAARVFSEQIV